MNMSRTKTAYTICSWEQLPPELQQTLEEEKKKAGTFSYHNSKYTYLVVCYGPKKYTGYSIKVEECSRGDHILYLRTQLLGPSADEPPVVRENWPWIVVRCERTEDLCLIES